MQRVSEKNKSVMFAGALEALSCRTTVCTVMTVPVNAAAISGMMVSRSAQSDASSPPKCSFFSSQQLSMVAVDTMIIIEQRTARSAADSKCDLPRLVRNIVTQPTGKCISLRITTGFGSPEFA